MMGSHKGIDPLTALLTLASDPAKVQVQLAKLQAATEAHQKAKEEAAQAKADAEKLLTDTRAYADEVDQHAIMAKQSIAEQLGKLNSERASFETVKREHLEALKAREIKVAADLVNHKEGVVRLQVAQQDHQKATELHQETIAKVKQEHLKKENEFSARENRLNAMSASLREREGKVAAAEASLSQRVQKMRDLAVG